MRTAAVLPIKSFPNAKQRLGVALGPEQRRALAVAMCRDVIATLVRSRVDPVIVVTAEPVAAAAARDGGARVVEDPVEAGQSAAAERGIAAARQIGAARVLLVPGDCPALAPEDVETLLSGGGRGPRVAIVPDRHGTGTNALLLEPPDAIGPSFGTGSFARHAERARAAGAAFDVAEMPSLQHDVDTPADLVALRALLAARHGVAPRTRRVLDGLAPALEAAGRA